jgi:hypothetical protein
VINADWEYADADMPSLRAYHDRIVSANYPKIAEATP